MMIFERRTEIPALIFNARLDKPGEVHQSSFLETVELAQHMAQSRRSIAVIIRRERLSRGLIRKSTAVNFLGLREYRRIAGGRLFAAGWPPGRTRPVSA